MKNLSMIGQQVERISKAKSINDGSIGQQEERTSKAIHGGQYPASPPTHVKHGLCGISYVLLLTLDADSHR